MAGVLKAPLPKGNAEDSFDVGRAFTEAKAGPPVRGPVVLQAADSTYALRQGDWKLVERVAPPKFEHRNAKKAAQAEKKAKAAPKQDELFNLKDDPAETKSLTATNADRAAQMKQTLTTARNQGFTRPDAR